MKTNKLIFELYRDADGVWYDEADEGRTHIEFYVKKPDRKVEQEANIYYNKELRKLLDKKSECLLRLEVNDILRNRGVWDSSKDEDLRKSQKAVSDVVAKLSRGVMKKTEGYGLALEAIKLRNKVTGLNMVRNSLDSQTAESKADETKLNYFIYRCTYLNSDFEDMKPGHLYFGRTDFETFLDSEDAVINYAGMKLMTLLYDIDDIRKQLPEWKFLVKYGFADEKLRLLDVTKSHFVNLDGKRVDERGNLLNDAGERVDEFDNLIVDMDKVEFAD